METKNFYFLLFVGFGAGLIFFGTTLSKKPVLGTVGGATLAVENKEVPNVVSTANLPIPPLLSSSSTTLELQARAVLAKDWTTGATLFEQHSTERAPIASLTKLMTALIVYKNFSLDEQVKITNEDLDTPPYRASLQPGDVFSVRSLLQAMLIASANDATLTLARYGGGGTVQSFVELMNREAISLGMFQTQFSNPLGLDDLLHYSTAHDLALLVEEFLKFPELVEITATREAVIHTVDGRTSHTLITTNKLMKSNPEIHGLKTGYTTEAKGNLIVFVSPPGYFSIVLGSQNREKDTEQLYNWIKASYIWTP